MADRSVRARAQTSAAGSEYNYDVAKGLNRGSKSRPIVSARTPASGSGMSLGDSRHPRPRSDSPSGFAGGTMSLGSSPASLRVSTVAVGEYKVGSLSGSDVGHGVPAAPSPEHLDTVLPRLVEKLSAFRKAVLSERKARLQLQRAADILNRKLVDSKRTIGEKDKQLLQVLQEKAELSEKVHLITVEPLPSSAHEQANAQVDQLLKDTKTDEQIRKDVLRVIEEHNTLKYHHQKLSERAQANQVQYEHERLSILSELDKLKKAYGNMSKELIKTQMREEEVKGQLSHAREQIQRMKDDESSGKGLSDRASKQLAKQLKDKERKLATLKRELVETKSLADVLAQRAFKYKERVNTLELQIRRFRLLRIRPLLPVTPVEISVKKITSSGEVLFVVSNADSKLEEHVQDVGTLFDVHAVNPSIDPTAMMNTGASSSRGVAKPDNSGGVSTVLSPHSLATPISDFYGRGDETQGVRVDAKSSEARADSVASEPEARGLRFCVLFRRPSAPHRCGQDSSEDSMMFQMESPKERNECVEFLMDLVETCREPDQYASAVPTPAPVVNELDTFFGGIQR